MEYASNGKANAGLATGIIGTSLAGLLWANGGFGGNGFLGGLFGNRGNGWNNGQVGYGPQYCQSFEGKIGQLEAEIAYLRGENYTDRVGSEIYRTLDNKIETNLEKLYNFVIDLDKRTALNAQGLMYENQITNNKIDCCCDKMDIKFRYENRLRDLADQAIINYVNGTFVPGKLVMPLTSICPPAAAATTTTTEVGA